jgi:hypothetical protein
MAVIKSSLAKLEIATAADAYTSCGHITSVTYDPGVSTEGTTALQSTVMQEQPLLDNPTLQIEGHVDLADTAQDEIRTAFASADKTFQYNGGDDTPVVLTLEDTSTTYSFSTDTIVTAYSESRPATGLPTFSATLKANTAVVIA